MCVLDFHTHRHADVLMEFAFFANSEVADREELSLRVTDQTIVKKKSQNPSIGNNRWLHSSNDLR